MGQQRFDKPDDWQNIHQTWLFDDFVAYLDAFTFTKTTNNAATVIINATDDKSQLWLGNAGNAGGAEAIVATTNKFWKWASNKPLHLIARINAAQANTNNLSLFIGFSSAFATGLVTNANPNAFLATTNSSCGFFLQSGSTTWSVVTQVGTAQTLTATLEAAAPANDQYLLVQADVVGTNIEATFMIGNTDATGGSDSVFPTGWQQCRESTSGFNKPIKHRVAFAGCAAMSGGVYLRQCSSTSETVKVDFIGMLNLR